jgi:hypothetical protein
MKAFNGEFTALYLSLSEEDRARVGKLIKALCHKDLAALQELAADTRLTEPMKAAFDNLVKDCTLEWGVKA